MQQISSVSTACATSPSPVLFHDGCRLCLDIAQTLAGTMPGLTIVDLSRHPEFKQDAVGRGVLQLPSLVVGTRVLPIAPHSDIGHIGATDVSCA